MTSYTCRLCLRASRQVQIAGRRTIERPIAISLSQSRALSISTRRRQTAATPRSSSDPEYAAPEAATAIAGSSTLTTQAKDAAKDQNLPPLPDIKTPTAEQLNSAMRASTASSATASLAHSLRKHAKNTTETYIAYGATEQMFKSMSAQADYSIPTVKDKNAEVKKTADGQEIGVPAQGSFWYEDLKLLPVFSTWAQITMLHMYILTVRLRMLDPKSAPIWHQHLTDHFFTLAEDRMELFHRITARMHRTKYLKDLHQQWRGAIAAYDEGLIKGDAAMAAAVWRNIYQAREDVDPVDLAAVVAYVRREIKRVAAVSHDSVETGQVVFEKGKAIFEAEKRGVLSESPSMKKPFTEGAVPAS